MGKAIVITGIDASVCGLGKVEFKTESKWLFGYDNSWFVTNNSGASFIGGTASGKDFWFGSGFSKGENYFVGKNITKVRLYSSSIGSPTIKIGKRKSDGTFVYTNEKQISAGYNEFDLDYPILLLDGETLAFNLAEENSRISSKSVESSEYYGINFDSTSGKSTLFIDFFDSL